MHTRQEQHYPQRAKIWLLWDEQKTSTGAKMVCGPPKDPQYMEIKHVNGTGL